VVGQWPIGLAIKFVGALFLKFSTLFDEMRKEQRLHFGRHVLFERDGRANDMREQNDAQLKELHDGRFFGRLEVPAVR
jgi:hypothetical protein